VDRLLEVLFGSIFDRPMGYLFGGGIRRAARDLKGKYDRAKAAGEPLVCDLPAQLRVHQPDKRGRGRWAWGVVQVRAGSLTWEPRAGKQGQRWNLTAASIITERRLNLSSSEYLDFQVLVMRNSEQPVEVAVRWPFLPFLHAGLEQIAVEPMSERRTDGSGSI